MEHCVLHLTKWLFYLFVLNAGVFESPVAAAKVRTLNKSPSTIETQAKFFQDFFSVQLSPYKVEFGHVCEDPNNWEQRYERKDYKNHRDMGKVRWGDKKGGYGEHYWDLNHAGHKNDHDDSYNNDHDNSHDKDYDDGSYHEDKYEDPYNEPSETYEKYAEDDYNPKTDSYDPNDRAKRAGKSKIEQTNNEDKEERISKDNFKSQKQTEQKKYEDDRKPQKQTEPEQTEKVDDEEYDQPNQQNFPEQQVQNKPDHGNLESKKPVEIAKVKPTYNQEAAAQWDSNQFSGFNPSAPWRGPHLHFGQRTPQHSTAQHSTAQQIQSPSVQLPRLYFEASTGRVFDRATGQTFVLQPLVVQN